MKGEKIYEMSFTNDLEKLFDTLENKSELQLLQDKLQQEYKFLAEENASMAKSLADLGLTNYCLEKIHDELTPQLVPGANENVETRLSKSYIAKLHMCIRLHLRFIEKLNNEIKTAKREFHDAEAHLTNMKVFSDDLKQLNGKVKRYESDITKLEEKYPWLKKFEKDFPNISVEMETLNKLREKRDALLQELNTYSGLKPDIEAATLQLKAVKEDYDGLVKSIKELGSH